MSMEHKAAKLKNEYLRTYVHKKPPEKKKKGSSSSVDGSDLQPNGSEFGSTKGNADGDALLADLSQNNTELTKKDASKLIRAATRSSFQPVPGTRRNEAGRTCAEERMKALMSKPKLKVWVPVSQRTWFTTTIGLAVVANAVQLGIEVDYPQYKTAYTVLENLFTVIFMLEMFTKFWEMRFRYFKDGWNLVDFVLVSLSILDCWILAFFIDAGEGPDLRIFSMLRILRILRLLRAVRLFKVFHELWKIVKGILDSLRAVGWAAILLIFQLYICGVFCCVMVGKNKTVGYLRFEDEVGHLDELGRDFDVYQFYGTVPRAMYTLFETCIEPLNIRPIIERQPWMIAFFFAFIFISTFGLLNVIIGVIVEHTLAVSDEKKNAEMVRSFQQKMDKLEYVRENCFVDQDDDDNISVEEIKEAWERPDVVETLEEVEMPLGLQPEEFFDLLDANGNGQVTHAEMLMQLTRATVHSEHQLLLDLKIGLHATQRQIRDVATSLAEFKGDVTTSLAELQGQMKYGFCQVLPAETMQSWPIGQCLASDPNPCPVIEKAETCPAIAQTNAESPSEDQRRLWMSSADDKCHDSPKAKERVSFSKSVDFGEDEKCPDTSKIQNVVSVEDKAIKDLDASEVKSSMERSPPAPPHSGVEAPPLPPEVPRHNKPLPPPSKQAQQAPTATVEAGTASPHPPATTPSLEPNAGTPSGPPPGHPPELVYSDAEAPFGKQFSGGARVHSRLPSLPGTVRE